MQPTLQPALWTVERSAVKYGTRLEEQVNRSINLNPAGMLLKHSSSVNMTPVFCIGNMRFWNTPVKERKILEIIIIIMLNSF